MFQKEIKGNLARLLATENLVVEHRNVPTAQFDVDRRVLTLPNWDKASNTVYDMLVGHEVGHALFTPNEDWTKKVKVPQSYVNVIEDVRIEKLMKRKYPGIRKSFSGGYAELNALDFFEIADENLDEFAFIDRINLHYKVGASAMLPFTEEEKVFVTRAENTETFDEVLTLADDIRKFVKASQEEQQKESNTDASLDSNFNGQNNNDFDSDSDSESQQPSNSDTTDEGINEESDIDDPNFDEGDLGGSEGGLHWEGETQEKFDRKTESLSDTSFLRDTTYVEIPDKVDLDKVIVDWKVIHDWIDQNAEESEKRPDSWDTRLTYADVDAKYQEFRNENKKEVSYLVKEFECRKSADAYARTSTAKTGVLDTSKLHTYKHSEDLFKRISIVPDGKNHGMIFILDWSGSMQYEILPTVKQLLNLTAFCKKVQIPFEVYAFTNERTIAQRAIDNNPEAPDAPYRYRSKSESLTKNEVLLDKGYFHLMNFVSSRSNSKDYERMCLQLFREARYYSRRQYQYGSASYYNTPGVGLSGTPLNEAIILLNYIVPQFRKDNDLQKVNCVVLTDGDACTTAYGREWIGKNEFGEEESRLSTSRIDFGVILRDRQTGIVYRQFTYGDCTNIFIQQLKDRNPDVNILGFRILNGTQLSSYVCTYGGGMEYYPQIQKQWRKEKSAIIPNPVAYSALYAISNNAIDADTTFEAKSDKKADISRAFRKMLSNKAVNKKLLNSFVGMVA